MMKRICLLFVVLLSSTLSSLAQTFVEIGKTYPVTADGDKYVVNGFNVFNNKSDELIFTNALLWAVENICPQLRDGIT